MSIRDIVIGDLKEPLVWKYTALAVILLILSFGLLGHFALDWGVAKLLGLAPDWILVRIQAIPGGGLISFLLAFLLFPLLMPLLGIVVMPILAAIQLMLTERLAQSLDAKFYAEQPRGRSSTLINLGVWLKWTTLKVVLFFFAIPLLHIPLLGTVFHIALASVWLSAMYFEVVTRRYAVEGFVWARLRRSWWWLTKAALLNALFTYTAVWVIGAIALALPPIRLAAMFVAGVLVTTGNFILLVELLRHYRDAHSESGGSQVATQVGAT